MRRVEELDLNEVRRHVEQALAEDVASGDVTTLATVPLETQARGRVVARQALRVAGIAFAQVAFGLIAPTAQFRSRVRDGQELEPGGVLIEVAGPARGMLTAERVALNYLQRLSGVATLTARFVAAVAGTRAQILDTRKTTPGWRRFEKYAVRCGGGVNHRFGLFDMVLIKDNHLAALRGATPNPVEAAVRAARTACPGLKIEVEVDDLPQLDQALAAGAEWVLLDNMTLAQLREAVRRCAGRARTEASGGVNLGTVRAIAETGVDAISVGALTHSAPAVDIALDFEL